MNGKVAVHMDRIKTFIQKGEFENNDWVIAGVIVRKHATTSQAVSFICKLLCRKYILYYIYTYMYISIDLKL